MIATLHRSLLALLLIAAVGSLCVASCFASASPEKQSAHACCHKNKAGAASTGQSKPARDCDNQPSEVAHQLHIAAPEFIAEPLAAETARQVSDAETACPAAWSPPDLLALHHTLLI